MANPQMRNMKNVFRGMCVIMVPLTYAFPTVSFTLDRIPIQHLLVQSNN